MKGSTGRMARLYDESGEAWYHVYNRVACSHYDYPLERRGAREQFIKILGFYSQAYICDIATFCVMGNHFHIIVKFPEYKNMNRDQLLDRVMRFYPNTYDQSDAWDDEKWEAFNRRLFDISSFMKNIQMSYARWYNKEFKRRGNFWADRFKSTLLYGDESMFECMQYVDLNPVRAGMVERPEDYKYSGFYRRHLKKDDWLVSLKDLLGVKDIEEAYVEYRSQVYLRGSVVTKENDKEISESVIEEETNRDFKRRGVFLDKCRFYIDGLALGSRDKLFNLLTHLREKRYYSRKKNPTMQFAGIYSLREQRSHINQLE